MPAYGGRMTSSDAGVPSGVLLRADGSPARLLVVDDEDSLVHLLNDALRFAGYDVVMARTGRQALERTKDSAPDLVVLDVMLPDLDGFEVCRRLRRDGNDVPVVFLTARDDPEGLRTGFTGGGDDYLTKPFSLEELRFRIEAVLRRSLQQSAVGERLSCSDIVLDVEAHQVWRGDTEVGLSATEFRLLRYLMDNQGRVLSRLQILDHVWDYDFGGDSQVVATYISYLRKKLDDDADPPLIQTVRGVGYVMRPPAASRASGMA
jgi:two-component system, OmpR family, response regulator